MIRTIEALIGISLLLTLFFLGIMLSQPQSKELLELKDKAEGLIKQKIKLNDFRQKVIDADVQWLKADLNAFIQTPLEVQVCPDLGETPASCIGLTPTIRNYVTINYLVSSTQSSFEAFTPKTLRVFVWLGR